MLAGRDPVEQHPCRDLLTGIPAGDRVGIVGVNGAGKSSLLNVINGVYDPRRGSVTFRGVRRRRMRPHETAKQGIARTFQNIALFKGMSVLDNIMTGRNLKMRTNLFQQAIRWGAAEREESAQRRVECLRARPANPSNADHRSFNRFHRADPSGSCDARGRTAVRAAP